ncbi:17353_t:CDS:2, partial [Funneliformis geosporum]
MEHYLGKLAKPQGHYDLVRSHTLGKKYYSCCNRRFHRQLGKACVLLVAHSETYSIGIPVNKQRLVYITEELHNDKKLEDYDFQSEGVMFLCMTLFVVLLSGKKINLKVFGDDTVENVKQKIQELEGIPLNQQRLVYISNEELRNEKKLEEYDFQNEGTMFLCMTLFVVVLSGKTITLRVSGNDTVKSVKQKIQEREGIPVNEQRLVYQSHELRENHKKLPEYNVQNDGTMYLTMRLPG